MAWTAPRTWVTGELVTASMGNQQWRDNMIVLHDGVVSTTLPGSPVNGDRVTFVDSTTNPSYQFDLRYNASSSSAYKWECVGSGGALEGTTAITIPRAGDWYVELGARGTLFSAAVQVTIDLTAGGITLSAFQGAGGGGTEGVYGSAFDKGRMNGLTASQVLTPTVAGSPTRQFIRATPARVS